MRTLNVRLAAILLGSLLAFGIAVYFIHGFQVRRNAGFYLQRAEEAQQEAEEARDNEEPEIEEDAYIEAAKNLQLYANLVPDDVNAVEKLGLLLADLGDYNGAYSTFEKVLRRDPQRMNIRRRLVEVAKIMRRFPDAREHLEGYLLPNAPDNGELLEMLGECQARADENDAAVESFQRSIEKAPHRVRAYRWLALVLSDRNRRLDHGLGAGRLAQADEWMTKLLASNPDSPLACLAYAEHITGLMQVRSADDALQHPILLDVMVPSLLQECLKHAIEELEAPAHDEAEVLLNQNTALLANALKRVINALRSDLTLEDADALLRAVQLGLRFDNVTDGDYTDAKDRAMEALGSELSAEDNETLQEAAKHDIFVAAAKHALSLFGSPALLLRAAKLGVLSEAIEQASDARTFIADDRAALAAAEKDGSLTAAIEYALADDGPDALTLAAKNRTVAEAVRHVLGNVASPKDDAAARPPVGKERAMIDAVRAAFSDRQLVADDRQRLLEVAQQDGVLPRIVARVVKASDTALQRNDRRALLLLAKAVTWKRDHDQARQYLQTGIELYPDDYRMYSALSDIHLRDGQIEEAAASLRQGLKATDNAPLLLWKAAGLLSDMGELEEAEQMINQLAEVEYRATRILPTPAVAESFLRARLSHARGQWLPASQALEKVRGRLTQWPDLTKQADALLGDCYARLGNTDRQIAALRRVLDADPFHRRALAGMAAGLERTGQTDEAAKYYRRLANLEGGGPLPLAEALLRNNLRKPVAERDFTEIERLMNLVAESDPESIPLAVLRAEVFLAQDKKQEAAETLSDARKRDPHNVDLWRTLVMLEQQLENWPRVEELLEEAKETIDDEVLRLVLQTQYEVQRHEDEAPQRIAAAVKAAEQLPEADRFRVLNSLLQLALRASGDDQSRQLCRQILALDPDNLRIHFLLFELTISTRDEAEMKKALAAIEKIEGKGPHFLYGSAVLLTLPVKDGQDKRLDQALKLLAQVRQQRPSWSQAILLAAGIYDQQGNREKALENYLRAIEMGQGNLKAYRRAVDLLIVAGRHAEANDIMAKLQLRAPELTAEDLRRRGTGYQVTGDLEGALKDARQVSESSDRYQDHVWLGQLLIQAAQRAEQAAKAEEAAKFVAEAEQSYRRAVELSDTTAATWVPLIRFYSATRQTQKAEQALNTAKTRIPADEAPLALAQIYEVMGQPEKARQQYETAVKAKPDDVPRVQHLVQFYIRAKNFPLAESQLKRILSGKLKAEPGVVVWARRNQAAILSTRPGYQNLQQAIRLIRENLTPEDPSIPDRRLLANLLARSPAQEQQQEAIRYLKGLPSPSADDRFALAKLYLAHNNWTEAAALLRNLGEKPQHLATYVRALLKRDELPSAEIYLHSLEELAPGELPTVGLRAELLFRQQKLPEALKLMTDFIEKIDKQQANRGMLLGQIARSLEQFGRRLKDSASRAKEDSQRQAMLAEAGHFAEEAENIYRDYVRERPGHRLLLAMFLARQGKIGETVKLLDSIWPDSLPDRLAQVLIAVMKSPVATKEQLDRADKILQSALKKYDQALSLKVVAADIRAFQGHPKEAESMYRAILRVDKNNAIAQNNLAVLLAMQKVKLDEAMKLVEKAIASAGPNGSMLDSRATVHMALDQPEKALDDLKLAIVQSPTPVRLFHLAQAHEQAGQREAAVKAFKEAQELGLAPNSLQALERPAYERLKKELKSS